MTQPVQSADDFLFGGGGASAKFPTVGTVVEGLITDKGVVQETDFKTKEKAFFKDGNPKMQLVVTLKTEQRDPEKEGDKGLRKVYASVDMKRAIAQAAKDKGLKELPIGAHLRILFKREVPTDAGSPKKEYEAIITPAADLSLAIGETTPLAQPAVAASTAAANPFAGVSPELLQVLAAAQAEAAKNAAQAIG